MHRDLVWCGLYVLHMFSANKLPRYQIMSNAMIRQDMREESNVQLLDMVCGNQGTEILIFSMCMICEL